jgi:hypothetical protein
VNVAVAAAETTAAIAASSLCDEPVRSQYERIRQTFKHHFRAHRMQETQQGSSGCASQQVDQRSQPTSQSQEQQHFQQEEPVV